MKEQESSKEVKECREKVKKKTLKGSKKVAE